MKVSAAALCVAMMLSSRAVAQDPQQNPNRGGYPQNPYAAPAPAEQFSKSYVALRLGAIVPKHKDMEGYDNGFALEGAIGFRVNENVALEMSVGRFSISAQGQGYLPTNIGTVVLADIKEDVVAYPVLATLRIVVPVEKLEVFGLVGGGVYFMSAEGEATAPGYMPISESDSDSPFGIHFGGGVNVRVSQSASIGAEVKYIIGTTKLWDSSSGFDSIMVGGGLTFHL